jgi:hypothetical protein
MTTEILFSGCRLIVPSSLLRLRRLRYGVIRIGGLCTHVPAGITNQKNEEKRSQVVYERKGIKGSSPNGASVLTRRLLFLQIPVDNGP